MNQIGTWFLGYTLIDITNTGVYKNNTGTLLSRNQQRNWETVLQVIGLRAQPLDIVSPRSPRIVAMSSHQFGSYYTGSHKCWKFKFYVEHNNVFGDQNNPTELLEKDINEVPIIPSLTESIALLDPVFYTNGILKNTYFKVSLQKC
jgi:hypothetical protein